MLMPKRVKHRRVFRGRMKGSAHRGNTISYGEYGLVALEPSWITSTQIEAARVAMTRFTKRGGQVWIKIFPDKPVTEKPAETRMGSGPPNTGWPWSSPAASCSRSQALKRASPRKPFVLPGISCPSAARS